MEIRIDSSLPRIPHKKHWQFCVGSAHALMALRTDYTRQLKFIHDTLGIQRVRFHGIFCDDMRTVNDLSSQLDVPGAEAFTEYYFNACGIAYENVLSAGMKPLVELSFMPEKLALKEEGWPVKGGFFYRPNIVPPADYTQWRAYLQAFVRFLLHRYGAEEVRTWLFEVWNEPDLPYVFWNGSRDEYFQLYAESARAIKDVDPQIQVGGPATSGSKWISSFLKYCRENDVPVDFVTTHQYAGDPLGGVEDQGDGEGQAGGSSIWCFSDIFEELHPFPQEFHGGFGMITQNGIPKPVYHAMKLLADAPDTRIDLGPEALDGEIGAAAFEGNGETHVILFRQKMKNLDLPKEEAVVRLARANRPKKCNPSPHRRGPRQPPEALGGNGQARFPEPRGSGGTERKKRRKARGMALQLGQRCVDHKGRAWCQ